MIKFVGSIIRRADLFDSRLENLTLATTPNKNKMRLDTVIKLHDDELARQRRAEQMGVSIFGFTVFSMSVGAALAGWAFKDLNDLVSLLSKPIEIITLCALTAGVVSFILCSIFCMIDTISLFRLKDNKQPIVLNNLADFIDANDYSYDDTCIRLIGEYSDSLIELRRITIYKESLLEKAYKHLAITISSLFLTPIVVIAIPFLTASYHQFF